MDTNKNSYQDSMEDETKETTKICLLQAKQLKFDKINNKNIKSFSLKYLSTGRTPPSNTNH